MQIIDFQETTKDNYWKDLTLKFKINIALTSKIAQLS